MFSWFDSKAAEEFGESLANFFGERVPAKAIAPGNNKALRKFDSVLERMHLRASEFRKQQALNVYKRAKLMNAFQWRLLELGYDKAMVGEMAKSLIRSL